MNVFELFAKLGLDSSEYDEGLDTAESKGSKFGEGLKKAAGVTAGAIAATTAATVAGAKAFISGAADVAAYGDNIDKMSQKMNMSATAYQEWDFVMQHAGTSIQSMQASIKTLSNAAETGSEAFEQLGLSQEEIASMSGEELFGATITALQGVEDETQRTYLAGQLLGRGATELGALLNMSADEISDMKQQAHELGGVMIDDAVKAAAGFQDSLQNVQLSLTGLKNNMLSGFLPAFSTTMDGLSKIFSGTDIEGGLKNIEEGVKSIADGLVAKAPEVFAIGGKILTALLTSITSNLPILLNAAVPIIMELITGIIQALPNIVTAAVSLVTAVVQGINDNLPQILEAAKELVLSLASSLAENAPILIPTIVELINTIVTTLTEPDSLTAFIQGALQLIMALADGIVAALPQLVAVIPEVIVNLVKAIIQNFPAILETVLYLIAALTVAVLESLFALMGSSLDEVMKGLGDIFSGIAEWGKSIIKWGLDVRNKFLEGVNNFFTNIKNFFVNGFNNMKTLASNGLNAIGNFFTNGFTNIKNKVSAGLEAVKNKFTSIFENVKNTVRNALNFLKNLFHFDWSLPKIKLPHFSVSGGQAPWGFAGQGSLPSVSVEWYKKAMDKAYMLDSATIFGAAGGKLLGGGESGSEMIIGTNKLMNMIKEASLGSRDIIINVYGAEGQDVRELAKAVSVELKKLMSDKENVYA